MPVKHDTCAEAMIEGAPEMIAQRLHVRHRSKVTGEHAGLAKRGRERRTLGAGAPPALLAGAVDQRTEHDLALARQTTPQHSLHSVVSGRFIWPSLRAHDNRPNGKAGLARG